MTKSTCGLGRLNYYMGNKADVRCSSRHWAPQANRQDHIGFRCAKTPLAPGQETPQSESQPSAANAAGKQQIPEEPKMIPITEDQSLSEIARHHPESVAKVIRARLNEQGAGDAADEAAILMITLGREVAAGVMKYLLDTEIEGIARAMSARKVVTADERKQAHEATKSRVLSGTHLDYGGPDYTSEVLEMAMGPRKARALMDRSIPESSPTQPLMNLDANQAVPFISKEHPQTIALILSRLDAKKSMAILMGMEEALRADVLYRMATMESVRTQTLRSLEEALAENLRSVTMGQVEVGGPKAVAELLSHAGEEKTAILARLRKQDEGLVVEIESQGIGSSE